MKKPNLILLVGIQGCGKTYYAKENILNNNSSNYVYISQDDFGKKKHFTLFLESLEMRKNIIVDRTNHTQKQRDKYTLIARSKDYNITIINLNKPFKECVSNLLQRTHDTITHTHPTFNPKNYKEASEILYKTLREYEPPLEDECDILINEHNFDPYYLDISEKFSNFLIVGDIHGCFDEFKQLLDNYVSKGYSLDNTAIVSVGDLVDKGPKSKEVLDFFYNSKHSSQCYVVRGNHEYKVQRYLRGNKITISHGLDITINQCNLDKKSSQYDSNYAKNLLEDLDSLPFMLKISTDGYVLHAGIHPNKSLFRQPKEYLLFARTFNPVTHSFNTFGDKSWFEYYSKNKPVLFFGHQEIKTTKISQNLYGLDGYCVFGGELRGAIVSTKNKKIKSIEIISVPANKKYYEKDEVMTSNLIDQMLFLEKQGYLKSSQKDNLILFNYTQKTMYEEYWNSYTMQARGLVFDKQTKQIVARPFGKFFNINENEFTQLHNLPVDNSFEVFEKVDGVLGIIFYYNSKWIITTRGEFDSVQSIIGEELLKSQINTSKMNPNYTYICEIIHPKCRVIVDYGNTIKLILLSCVDTLKGEEISYIQLKEEAKQTGFEIINKIDSYSSVHQIIEEKDTWPSNFEGVVIRFNDGLRVKVKSTSYNALMEVSQGYESYKLLNYLDYHGDIDEFFIKNIPEELRDKVLFNLNKLSLMYRQIYSELENDILQIQRVLLKKLETLNNNSNNSSNKNLNKKLEINSTLLQENITFLGEIVYKNSTDKSFQNLDLKIKHKNAIMYYIKSQKENIHFYILKELKKNLKKPLKIN